MRGFWIKMRQFGTTLLVLLLGSGLCHALTDRFRCSLRDDPATTMVIGWHQVSGEEAVVYYDTQNYGQDYDSYAFIKSPDTENFAKGMHTFFARLENLAPNTVYYFLIRDSEGISETYSFKTLPDNPNMPVSIISGGDSRNYRSARRNANLLVSKLRPDLITFAGDMTGGDNAPQWQAWLDDWQYTIGEDNRIFPIIVARGNHELDNQVLVDMFDVPSPHVVYGLSIGGNLMRIYTLNSMLPPGGKQRIWLKDDLIAHSNTIWKLVQYHNSMRPHTRRKTPKNSQVVMWATLFHRFGVDIVIESDAHVVKSTWPIRPSLGPGSDHGFIRDDRSGTVYLGEGCWGAPLRKDDQQYDWTRAHGSFNQFKWMFVDGEKIEIRTVKVDNALAVETLTDETRFTIPNGLDIWDPPTGPVITLYRKGKAPIHHPEPFALHDFKANRQEDYIVLRWETENEPPHMYFEIKRSLDGENYTTFDRIWGNSSASNNVYEYIDDGVDEEYVGMVTYRVSPKVSNQPPGSDPLRPREVVTEEIRKMNVNPKTGRFVFSYKLLKRSDITYRLMDDQQKVLEATIIKDQKPGFKSRPFNMNPYEDGKYFLDVEADGKIIRRFVILKADTYKG